MKPIKFKESNKILIGGDNSQLALNVYCNGEQIISKWKMNWKERFQAIIYGNVWLHVLSKESHSPVNLQTYKTAFDTRDGFQPLANPCAGDGDPPVNP